MKAIRFILCVLLASLPCAASTDVAPLTVQSVQPIRSFDQLVEQCAPAVNPVTLKAVIKTESSFNPFAIGVVNGHLERQPRNLDEAIATARVLEKQDYNFSLGLGQVNRHNLAKYHETYETIFEPCHNLKIGSEILKNCYATAKAQMGDEQKALRAAFSCYYSGNFTSGFKADAGKPSYVAQVVANAADAAQAIPVVPEVKPETDDETVSVHIKHSDNTAADAKPSGFVEFPGNQAQQNTAAPKPWISFPDRPQTESVTVQARPAPSNPPSKPSGNQPPAFVQIIN